MEMNLEHTKLDLIQWLSTLGDANVLRKIAEIRKEESTDWWNEISEVEKKSIEKGIKQADKGNLKPHSEAFKAYGKWL